MARWMIVIGLCLMGAATMAQTITIGTFNIHKPEATPAPDRMKNIARFCEGIDLLALQEVDETGSEVETIAGLMGSEYRWCVSDVTLHERFGFIWRPPVVQIGEPGFCDALDLGRKPYSARFRAGNFDFEIVTVHLFWQGSKKTYPHTRGVEIKKLDDWLCDRKDPELDLILTGDFNEPQVYYGMNYPPPHSSHAFFYDFLARHGLLSVSLEQRIPTSLMNANIYDHIIFNTAGYFTSEFAGSSSIAVRQWEKEFDISKDGVLDYREFETAKGAASDHRIVTAVFRIDQPDDDE